MQLIRKGAYQKRASSAVVRDRVRCNFSVPKLRFGKENAICLGSARASRAHCGASPQCSGAGKVCDGEGAIAALENDHDFLLKGDVFNSDFITNWLEMKQKEYDALRLRPHPYEFSMYYDV